MTDFLSRLLGKAQGDLPVLQRRRPSLFEAIPRSQQFVGGRGPTPAQSAVEESSLESAITGEESKAPRVTARPAAVPPEKEVRRAPELLGPIVPGKAVPSRFTPPLVTPADSATPGRLRSREESRNPEGEPQKTRPRSAAKASVPEASPTLPPPVLHRARREVTRHSLDPSPPAPFPDDGTPPASRFGGSTAQLLASPARIVMGPVSPPSPGFPATPPAEPTIQVTIGRIEVRAVTPGSRPKSAASAAPRLSLEDYLRSRGGGTR